MRNVVDKVAVVTGGGQGIGRAMAERFAAEGMKVVIADVVPELVETTSGELRDQGLEVIGVVTDVTSLESVEALREATLEAYGAVHLVCNNAGIGSGSEGQIWEHHVNDWRWSLDVNVMGVVNGINAFVPTLLAQDEEGHVVNTTSSNGGFTPLSNSAVYATTKAAVTTITECLWGQLREVGAKVSASLLYPSTTSPGMLNTGIWRPGANRPHSYDRPGAPPTEGRDASGCVPPTHGRGGHRSAVRPAVGGGRHLFPGHCQRHVLDHRPQRPATTEDPRSGHVADRDERSRVPTPGKHDDLSTDGQEGLIAPAIGRDGASDRFVTMDRWER